MKLQKDFEISINIKINNFDSVYFVSENHCRAYISVGILGLKVFPKNQATKKPFLKNGRSLATKDTKQIDAWWSNFPSADVGLVYE